MCRSTREALSKQQKRRFWPFRRVDTKAGATGPRQKIKVDRQIVAIAKVCQVDCLYSEDSDVAKIAVPMGVTVQGLSQIPLPPEDAQQPLFPGEPSD